MDDPDGEHKDMYALFDQIVAHVPAPQADPDSPFQMLVTTMEADPFLGRILTGRIQSGEVKPTH